MFRSSTQFELYFIWRRYSSTSLFCMWISSFPRYHLLKRLSFPHWMALAFSKTIWPSVQVLPLGSVFQCALCGSPYTSMCVVSYGPFSSDDRWLCACPVLCLGRSDNAWWDVQASSHPLSCVKVFAFSQGSRASQERFLQRQIVTPQEGTDSLPNPGRLCCAAAVGTCPEGVYSVLNSPGTPQVSLSLLDRAEFAAEPKFCSIPLETGSLVSDSKWVSQ